MTTTQEAVEIYAAGRIDSEADSTMLNLIKECAIESWMNYGNGLNDYTAGNNGGALNRFVSGFKDRKFYEKFGIYPGENRNDGFNLVI